MQDDLRDETAVWEPWSNAEEPVLPRGTDEASATSPSTESLGESEDNFEGGLCSRCQALKLDDRHLVGPSAVFDGHEKSIFPPLWKREARNPSGSSDSDDLDSENDLSGSSNISEPIQDTASGIIPEEQNEDPLSSEEDETRTSATASLSQSEGLETSGNHSSIRSEDTGGVWYIGVDYFRSDEFPEMPSLAKSSDDGCHFCRMVISAVRAEYRHLEEEDRISACHRVSLDEMRFRWSEKRGLSLLEVEALFEAEHGFCVASLFSRSDIQQVRQFCVKARK